MNDHIIFCRAGARSPVQRLLILPWIIAWLLCCSSRLAAQELEPLTYSNTPTGINLIGIGVGYSRGNILLDPSLPIEDLDGDLVYGVVRYIRTFELLGGAAKFGALVPFTAGKWTGQFDNQPFTRDTGGSGDIRLDLDWSVYGAPAMSQAEMGSYEQRTIAGVGLRVIAPTGDYDSDKAINLGSNRWSVRGEFGVSHPLGPWTFEGFGAIWIYGKNDNLVGRTQEQDNLYVIKADAIYSFRPGFWAGFGVAYGEGGRTTIDGVPRNNRQQNWRFMAAAAYPINARHGISLTVGSGINRGAGGEYDTIVVGYKYAWGNL